MIASTQKTNTEIFAFIAVLVLRLLSRKVLFINRKDNRNCGFYSSVVFRLDDCNFKNLHKLSFSLLGFSDENNIAKLVIVKIVPVIVQFK